MMKKPILIAPRNQAREMDRDSPDCRRLLASGSYCVVQVPPKSRKGAHVQRNYKQRLREKGYRELMVWVPGELLEALHAEKLPGESLAGLLARLLSYLHGNNLSDAHKLETAETPD